MMQHANLTLPTKVHFLYFLFHTVVHEEAILIHKKLLQDGKNMNFLATYSLKIDPVFISNLKLTIDLLHLYIILNEWNNIGVILSTVKINASNPIYIALINFKYMGKSQKKIEVKLDCSLNQTVCYSF